VLLFSEYVEGSGNNKAVEIANVGGAALSTAGCSLVRYQNGASTPLAPDLPLDGASLGPGEVFVVCNDGFAQASLCDQLSSGLSHSGNDVVALDCWGLVDVIGRVGEDTVWGSAPTVTQDATLRRACSVQSGDTNGADPFDPALEWEGFPADTFGGLGQLGCP
jgi:predicted extracellular nuclease